MATQQMKIALWRTVRAAFGFYGAHFGTLIKINAITLALLVAVGLVLNSVLIHAGFRPDVIPLLAVLSCWALSLYLLCHTVVTTQRYVLLDERPAKNYVSGLFNKRTLRCLGYLAIFIVAGFYGFNEGLGWLGFFVPTMSIIVLVAALLLWAMLGKFVLVLPAMATDAKTGLMTALVQTKGNSLRVFFIILLIFLPFVVAHQLALWFDPYQLGPASWALAALRALIVMNAAAAASVGLALTYRALVMRPQAGVPQPLTRGLTVGESAPRVKWVFRSIIATGVVLPWAVGIGVKLYLDLHGRPTWPWGFFLDPAHLAIESVLTLVFASPFIALAFFARYLLSASRLWGTRYWERLLVVLCGLLGGAIGAIQTFLWVFWVFDPMVLFGRLPLLYVDNMLLGLFVGCVIAALSVLTRKLIFRSTVYD